MTPELSYPLSQPAIASTQCEPRLTRPANDHRCAMPFGTLRVRCKRMSESEAVRVLASRQLI
jgi:hypothetical protein